MRVRVVFMIWRWGWVPFSWLDDEGECRFHDLTMRVSAVTAVFYDLAMSVSAVFMTWRWGWVPSQPFLWLSDECECRFQWLDDEGECRHSFFNLWLSDEGECCFDDLTIRVSAFFRHWGLAMRVSAVFVTELSDEGECRLPHFFTYVRNLFLLAPFSGELRKTLDACLPSFFCRWVFMIVSSSRSL